MADSPGLDPHWLQALLARAQSATHAPRLPLMLDNQRIGSVQANLFASLGPRLRDLVPHCLEPMTTPQGECWSVVGNATDALCQIAQTLRQTHTASVDALWRDELLTVRDAHANTVARVERGAVRALGIATRAVHLVGSTADGRVWVQQRSWRKSTDPGQWDTLMGGMIGADETLESALERETWEEAGLRLSELQHLRRGGTVHTLMPNPQDQGAGLIDERIDWFEALLPQDQQPSNRDGEVEQFALLDRAELKTWLEQDTFTTEAALILVQWLQSTPTSAP